MAGADRARRWARRPAAHPWQRHGLRLLFMAALAGAMGLGAAWAGLPQWTLVIGVLVCLIVDDAAGRYVRKWSPGPRRSSAGSPDGPPTGPPAE
ncbi:hypothetical protein ACH4C6_09335 [Streptomyces sp. NPDC017943]|uniref:hypothetical protein n=1 Tax=Streptomyces sp. NPDC017943 TaxID=3365019 RepID=UPI0037A88D76